MMTFDKIPPSQKMIKITKNKSLLTITAILQLLPRSKVEQLASKLLFDQLEIPRFLQTSVLSFILPQKDSGLPVFIQIFCGWISLSGFEILRSTLKLDSGKVVFRFLWFTYFHSENKLIGSFFLCQLGSSETRLG